MEKLEWTVHFSQMNSIRRFGGQIQSIKQQCGIKWKRHIKESHALWSQTWLSSLYAGQYVGHLPYSWTNKQPLPCVNVSRRNIGYHKGSSSCFLTLSRCYGLYTFSDCDSDFFRIRYIIHSTSDYSEFQFVSLVLSVMSVSGFSSIVCLHMSSVDSTHATKRNGHD